MIRKIVSGGQTGVDRAALDVAIAQGLDYGGWCPRGGWAEDQLTPPGLLTNYPNLLETPSPQPAQRTEWNVRDSSATLVLIANENLGLSVGTQLTSDIAFRLEKPILIYQLCSENAPIQVWEWLRGLEQDIILNIAGPRESEFPGIYVAAQKVIRQLLNTELLNTELASFNIKPLHYGP
ncbi:MAG: putative molybdenum carrier protein [Elainella sp.]